MNEELRKALEQQLPDPVCKGFVTVITKAQKEAAKNIQPQT